MSEREFDEFYRGHFKGLVARVMERVTYRMTWAEAEEIVQDAFISAWENWDSFTGVNEKGDDVPRSSWMIGILNNKVLHSIRNRERCGRPTSVNRVEVEAVENSSVDRETPENAYAYAELKGTVIHALLSMKPQFREAMLWMLANAGDSVEETAQQMGISPTTLRTRLHRGRAQIEAQIQRSNNSRRMVDTKYLRLNVLDNCGPPANNPYGGDSSIELSYSQVVGLDPVEHAAIFRQAFRDIELRPLDERPEERTPVHRSAPVKRGIDRDAGGFVQLTKVRLDPATKLDLLESTDGLLSQLEYLVDHGIVRQVDVVALIQNLVARGKTKVRDQNPLSRRDFSDLDSATPRRTTTGDDDDPSGSDEVLDPDVDYGDFKGGL